MSAAEPQAPQRGAEDSVIDYRGEYSGYDFYHAPETGSADNTSDYPPDCSTTPSTTEEQMWCAGDTVEETDTRGQRVCEAADRIRNRGQYCERVADVIDDFLSNNGIRAFSSSVYTYSGSSGRDWMAISNMFTDSFTSPSNPTQVGAMT